MDPIANMLTAIRNAQAARLAEITIPASKVKTAILTILKREGYIADFTDTDDLKKQTVVTLLYQNRLPVINSIRRVSKPGLRIYRKHMALPRPLRGMGLAIISTPNGLMTDKQARKLGVGGEIICEIY